MGIHLSFFKCKSCGGLIFCKEKSGFWGFMLGFVTCLPLVAIVPAIFLATRSQCENCGQPFTWF